MEDSNSRSPQPLQESEASPSEVNNLSQRLEALEHSVRYLEDNMVTRLSALEERVEAYQELLRRMDVHNILSRSWPQQVPLEVPTAPPNPPAVQTPAPVPSRHKKQGTLTSRRVIRRYQRLVKPSWDNKPSFRRIIRRITKRKRQQS